MNRFKLLFVLGVLLLLVPVALAAADGGRDVRGGVAFINGGDIGPIDPAQNFISFGWQIEYATCAELVNYPDSATPTAPQPEVAKSVDVSADGLTYSFKLRGGYRFSPPSNAPVTGYGEPGCELLPRRRLGHERRRPAARDPARSSGGRLSRAPGDALHVRGAA